MKNSAGFTLLEVLVTVAVILILTGISAISFDSWTTKSNIEKQTRELFTDITEARTNAFTQKIVYGIVFQPTSYVMKTYSSETEYLNPTTKGKVVTTKPLKYTLTKVGTTSDISNTPVIFDTTGFTNDLYTIIVNPLTAQSATNCVVIHYARANMGKINGTNCEFR